MLSRIGAATKADYFKRIDVFEQAFENGYFEKINWLISRKVHKGGLIFIIKW